MSIDYDHSRNTHTSGGAEAAFQKLVEHLSSPSRSLLDVGCGTGVWLQAALKNGIVDVGGVDGVSLPAAQLVVPPTIVQQHDLRKPLQCGRRFDVVICLEVAEHLDPEHAATLVASLVNAADQVVFSAACPGQPGQHHVNCQWPAYWQHLFNMHGFECDDAVRWAMWDDGVIEPWYRQNMFIARLNPTVAGTEPRIAAVRHPELPEDSSQVMSIFLQDIEKGGMPLDWYLTIPAKAILAKAARGSIRWLRRLIGVPWR